MQAISTKFISPTNFRGSRYKASCEAGSRTLDADHSLSSEANHIRVARALIIKLGWIPPHYGDWHHGGTPTGYVFVCGMSYTKVELEAI